MGQLLFKGHIVIKCWTYVGHVRSCPGLDYGLLYGFPKAYMMYMYVCIYMYMYVCMYVCMCVYIYNDCICICFHVFVCCILLRREFILRSAGGWDTGCSNKAHTSVFRASVGYTVLP